MVVGESLTFTNNTAKHKAGAISVGTQSNVTLTNVSFYGNTALEKGGCIMVTDDSVFNCN